MATRLSSARRASSASIRDARSDGTRHARPATIVKVDSQFQF